MTEPDKWQWIGPITVDEWKGSYDPTNCGSGLDGHGAGLTECKGSATTGTLDVSSQGYEIGWHGATGGSCADGASVNQFAASTNVNVLMELNFGYNWGHAVYLHFDCQHACSHPCNSCGGSGVNNTTGAGAERLLVGNQGAPGPDCGTYDKDDSAVVRPTISFAYRER